MSSNLTGPRIGELFAGAGGIGMGLKAIWPDAQVSWVSDIKPGACKVLAHRFPDAPNLGDITKIDWQSVEPVDIITGGSPCQDLSHAGKRAGMKPGTRSGLWASMCDAIDILRPSLVIWENVRGALSAEATIGDLEQCEFCMDDDGAGTMRALGRVLGDLADIGYDAGWVGLRAADVGAPHGRFRVFVLAWPADTDGGRLETWHATGRRLPVTDARGVEPVALPTPRATDGTKGGPNRRGSKGDLMLPSAVAQLLPTPAVNDMGAGKTVEHWDTWTEAMKAKHGNGNGHGKSLHIEAARETFGQYAPAIARWEPIVGYPAPAPVEPTGKGGANRLSGRFTEWMMGWPAGWVTDAPGVTRNEALSICGDGVIPQQAEAAVRHLLQLRDTYARAAA